MTKAVMAVNSFYGRLPLQPAQLVDRITRSGDVIVLCHVGIPKIEADQWSLLINGLVKTPQRLTLHDLKRWPKTTITAVHQCAGSPLEPDAPARRVCNVAWGGVRLAPLLDECGVDPQAAYLWSYGADHGSFSGIPIDSYLKDLPLARVADDVLIAYELNGQPLPIEHGFPARLLVPGFYGTNSVKWLTRIELAKERASSPFTTRWYNDIVLLDNGAVASTEPVWSIAPQSVIVSPAPEARLTNGLPAAIWGWAWADGGAAHVEVSCDGGLSWQRCELEPQQARAWQRFTCSWIPEAAGTVTLQSRARAASGAIQPAHGKRNAIHQVAVRVG